MSDHPQGLKPIAAPSPQRGALSTASPTSTDPQTAANRALLLLGSYRKGDAEDPDTYATAVAAVLSQYPADVVQRVTDPRTGIAGRSKWLPNPSEVREACEAEMAHVDRAARRARDLAAQLEREQESLRHDRERASRPTGNELQAKYGVGASRSMREVEAEAAARRSEARASAAAVAQQQREREVVMDWGDDPVPTIAGVPISRELHDLLTKQRRGL